MTRTDPKREAVLSAVKHLGEADAREIAAECGLPVNVVTGYLVNLWQMGHVANRWPVHQQIPRQWSV